MILHDMLFKLSFDDQVGMCFEHMEAWVALNILVKGFQGVV